MIPQLAAVIPRGISNNRTLSFDGNFASVVSAGNYEGQGLVLCGKCEYEIVKKILFWSHGGNDTHKLQFGKCKYHVFIVY